MIGLDEVVEIADDHTGLSVSVHTSIQFHWVGGI